MRASYARSFLAALSLIFLSKLVKVVFERVLLFCPKRLRLLNSFVESLGHRKALSCHLAVRAA